ncbi:porin family protein [Aquimarina mytili]|uniref:PorT family protein n=1 Tax=Aquimarina mytili TaxID=874423 RepID=A0A937DA07_9FLAO|nr:porin family protein [Aquimarina mytili]MBL0685540.1 PorT family protein [Aquimarina mytili]
MKKLFLLAIAVISFSLSSQAQNVKFGFKGGLNLADVDFEVAGVDPDSRTGYHIGAVLQLGLADTFAIQPELLYSTQGTDIFDVDYLNIPVLAKLKFAKIFSVEAGPQFGFVVNDGVKNAFFSTLESESFDISGAVGAGVEFGPVFGQIRYNFGLTDVVDGFDGKNKAFQISVGYYIF